MSLAKTYEILPKLLKGVAGALLAILVLWVIAGVAGWREKSQLLPGTERDRAQARYDIKRTLDEEAAKINELSWIDEEKGAVHLPIQKAMEVVAAELSQKATGPSAVKAEWVGPKMPDYNAPAPAAEGEAIPTAAAAGATVAGPGAAPAAAAAAIPAVTPPVDPQAPAAQGNAPTAPAPTAAPAVGAQTVPATPTLPAPSPEPASQDPVQAGEAGSTPAGSTSTSRGRPEADQPQSPDGPAVPRDSTQDVNPVPAGTVTPGADGTTPRPGVDFDSEGLNRPTPGAQSPEAKNAEKLESENQPAPGSSVQPPTGH